MQHSINLSDRDIEALLGFSWYRCDTKPNLEIAKHAVSMAKAFGIKIYIASTLWCLGTTYAGLGETYAAYDHLQEAYQLFNAIAYSKISFSEPISRTSLPLGGHELQRLCCKCGIDLVDTARLTFKDRDKAVSLARDVEKKSATVSDDVVHGRSLALLGMVLVETGQRQEALRHLEHAKLMTMGSIYVIEACQVIALVHYHGNRLPEALDAVKEAWEHAKSSNIMRQADISLTFGMILFSANRDTEAWKYIEISLMKSSQLGNRSSSAVALEYMGYGYLRRGDYLNAYGAYEAAAENFLGTDVEERSCTRNMAKIKDKQRNPDLNVGFNRPLEDNNWESLFYPAVQDMSG